MNNCKRTGILLVNLGTPDSPSLKDVKRYLVEFLTDPRVIDLPWLKRQLLVRGFIIPKRYKSSAAAYQQIWTEQGSPLMLYGLRVKQLLQEKMGDDYVIELAMRYQNPSIASGIDNLIKADVDSLIIFPLFPQYASATTGSVHQKVMEVVKEYSVIPETTFIEEYAAHPAFLDVFAAIGSEYDLKQYDHILLSFHGLPESQIRKADKHNCCLKTKDCCQKISRTNKRCYSAQCYATAHGIAERLNIPKDQYTVCFQSRLGSDPWLQPYASETIKSLAKQGHKKVLVFCPSFVCDCLETIFEYGVEYNHEFQKAGGERLDLVEGLNDDSRWIEALSTLVKREEANQLAIHF